MAYGLANSAAAGFVTASAPASAAVVATASAPSAASAVRTYIPPTIAQLKTTSYQPAVVPVPSARVEALNRFVTAYSAPSAATSPYGAIADERASFTAQYANPGIVSFGTNANGQTAFDLQRDTVGTQYAAERARQIENLQGSWAARGIDQNSPVAMRELADLNRNIDAQAGTDTSKINTTELAAENDLQQSARDKAFEYLYGTGTQILGAQITNSNLDHQDVIAANVTARTARGTASFNRGRAGEELTESDFTDPSTGLIDQYAYDSYTAGRAGMTYENYQNDLKTKDTLYAALLAGIDPAKDVNFQDDIRKLHESIYGVDVNNNGDGSGEIPAWADDPAHSTATNKQYAQTIQNFKDTNWETTNHPAAFTPTEPGMHVTGGEPVGIPDEINTARQNVIDHPDRIVRLGEITAGNGTLGGTSSIAGYLNTQSPTDPRKILMTMPGKTVMFGNDGPYFVESVNRQAIINEPGSLGYSPTMPQGAIQGENDVLVLRDLRTGQQIHANTQDPATRVQGQPQFSGDSVSFPIKDGANRNWFVNGSGVHLYYDGTKAGS